MTQSVEPVDSVLQTPTSVTAERRPAANYTLWQWVVLGLICSLSMITYLDRVCFGVAAPSLASELNLRSVAELKWAFTAFAIAYAVFEIPTGWLGDRWGPRSMLIRIVIWWSICTALTGLIGLKIGSWTLGGLGTLVLLRFLFGAGEAGAFPNISRAIYNWFPSHKWEFAQGLVWMSGRLMGGITPLIWALLVTGTTWSPPVVNWRGAFLLFGVLGVVWCVLFRLFFTDHPRSANGEPVHPVSGQSAGSHAHGAVPWKWLLTNRELLALCAAYSFVNYGWAFNITYLPAYLKERFPDPSSSTLIAIYTGAPLWVGAAGCVMGGYCVSWIDARLGNRRQSRCVVGMLAMLACAGWWGLASQADNLHLFCISVAMAAFCVDLTLGAAWATCQDIGRTHTAVAAAFMNTVGTLGAAFAGWVTGSLVERAIHQLAALSNVSSSSMSEELRHQGTLNGFHFVFLTYAAVYVLAAVCWFVVMRNTSENADPASR
ncbi:MFS transporter [Planctomicrobium sp. SH661]|uniref:MFS transporter n=1 Tax=Planctomicrobium sp. SH661 TaxID=3448124 RepID=UPI003F5C2650